MKTPSSTRVLIASLGLFFIRAGASLLAAAEDPTAKLAAGVVLLNRVEKSAVDREVIGRKLGGKIAQLTNAFLQVHGARIQVNVITAADERSANAIHAALLKIKPEPFCIRRGDQVVEFVGNDLEEGLARKTSYELGLVPKPGRVNYHIEAELAVVDRADYMFCSLLFNEFLKVGTSTQAPVQPVPESIASLARQFRFGRSLVLRHPKLTTTPGTAAGYRFKELPVRREERGSGIVYEFGDPLPVRMEVPFVAAVLDVPVSDTGLSNDVAKPGLSLTAATEHWPVNDAEIKQLAEVITRGRQGDDAKVKAILEWLTPGRNIKYSGQTGSRWGTLKVLQQRFGHCWDFADCFVALSRASGIPARQVAGWLYASSGHVWAEYYRDGIGWQQVDPTGGGALACGIYHIAYFTTEDGEMPIVYLSMPKITATTGQP